jgi:hypothetical protein
VDDIARLGLERCDAVLGKTPQPQRRFNTSVDISEKSSIVKVVTFATARESKRGPSIAVTYLLPITYEFTSIGAGGGVC